MPKNCKVILAAVIIISLLASCRYTVADEKPASASDISTGRKIPEDNLDYPALLTLKNGTGSGFFLNTLKGPYLVTANHVIADDPSLMVPETPKYTPDAEMTVTFYIKNIRYVLHLNLRELQDDGDIRIDPIHDIAAILVGTISGKPPSTTTQSPLSLVPGVTLGEGPNSMVIRGVSLESVRTLDQVLIGNDVIMYGYPTSLGLKQLPQLDPEQPLLRKGIVAAKNLDRHSLILDCPAYFGNSGGPVFEMDQTGFSTTFWLIGVVDQYVPFAESSATITVLNNSGYSIATPMDAVLELTK
jgi:hypothetical protein